MLRRTILTYERTKHKAIAVAGLLLLLTAAPAWTQDDKLAPDLANVAEDQTIDVIIQLEEPEARPGARRQPAPLALPTGLNLSAHRPVTELGLIRALSARVGRAALASLAADPRVKYISPDRQVSASLEFATPAVFADVAHRSGFTGAGVGIAVIDSGVYPQSDFNTPLCNSSHRIVYSESFVANEPAIRQTDWYGHGTHVAGVLAGNGNTCDTTLTYTRRFTGVAPQANLINLRVLDKDGKGTDSAVIRAIDRAIQLKTQHNIRVINLSLGRRILESYTKDPLCQAVERAWAAGIVVVVAAGNRGRDNSFNTNGYGTIGSPGNDPYVITVGAMRDMGTVSRADDLIASYSSKGPTALDKVVKPDLVAPGQSPRRAAARSNPHMPTDHCLVLGYPLRLPFQHADTRRCLSRQFPLAECLLGCDTDNANGGHPSEAHQRSSNSNVSS